MSASSIETTCPACRAALADPLSGAYRASCLHCSARAIANGPGYHEARVAGRITPVYARMLRELFGADRAARESGHRTVMAWHEARHQDMERS